MSITLSVFDVVIFFVGIGVGLLLPHGHRYFYSRHEPYRRYYDRYRRY